MGLFIVFVIACSENQLSLQCFIDVTHLDHSMLTSSQSSIIWSARVCYITWNYIMFNVLYLFTVDIITANYFLKCWRLGNSITWNCIAFWKSTLLTHDYICCCSLTIMSTSSPPTAIFVDCFFVASRTCSVSSTIARTEGQTELISKFAYVTVNSNGMVHYDNVLPRSLCGVCTQSKQLPVHYNHLNIIFI